VLILFLPRILFNLICSLTWVKLQGKAKQNNLPLECGHWWGADHGLGMTSGTRHTQYSFGAGRRGLWCNTSGETCSPGQCLVNVLLGLVVFRHCSWKRGWLFLLGYLVSRFGGTKRWTFHWTSTSSRTLFTEYDPLTKPTDSSVQTSGEWLRKLDLFLFLHCVLITFVTFPFGSFPCTLHAFAIV
jgi:hypothetical protein